MDRKERVAEQVEKVVTSPGKLKIIRLLMTDPGHAFTRYEIGKKLPLRPVDIRTDLSILVETGWVKELRLQHLQKYSANLENPLVKEFLGFFREIGYI